MKLKNYIIIFLLNCHYLAGIAFLVAINLWFLGFIAAGYISAHISGALIVMFVAGLAWADSDSGMKKSEEDNREKPNKKIVIDIKLDKKDNDNSK